MTKHIENSKKNLFIDWNYQLYGFKKIKSPVQFMQHYPKIQIYAAEFK